MSKNKPKETKDQDYWIVSGMCIGISIGTAVGAGTNNMALWLPIGLCIGLSLGLAFSSNKNDKNKGEK